MGQTKKDLRPFLKWAGGKRQLLATISQYFPRRFGSYYEPFLGAGAVLFTLQPTRAVVSDVNTQLMDCYSAVKRYPDELLGLCRDHQQRHDKDYYYLIRDQVCDGGFYKKTQVERAAAFIYLNKTCFNGLFRVNSRGKLNVPYGYYSKPTIANASNIKAISEYLNKQGITISAGDFSKTVVGAREGDFIYFDPPYYPISTTSSFAAYNAKKFLEREQVRLKETCDDLIDRGCQVLISNSSADFIRETYSDRRYKIISIEASRSINSVAARRGRVKEFLIHSNYDR